MMCALLQDNVVVDVQDLDEAGIQAASNYLVIDITGLQPIPQVGWVLQGNKLVLGPGMSPVNFTQITKLALRERFTPTELVTILAASQQMSSGQYTTAALQLQMIMGNLEIATYVDLSRPDTQAAINSLVLFGLITSARANTILTTPPTEIELYKG